MKTKTFCNLIERAIVACYGEANASSFDTVPYLDESSGRAKLCLGIFLNDAVHMASVAAQAMLYIHEDPDSQYDGEFDDIEKRDEAMFDFVQLMQIFRVAPYMVWTCIYFPGLTDECVNTDDIPERDDV